MRKNGIKKTRFFSSVIHYLLQQKEILQKMDMFSVFLVLPLLLSLLAASFEGISLGLLVPVARGIIERDFTFVREVTPLKGFISKFPQLFITPNSSVFIFLVMVIFVAVGIKNMFMYFSALSINFQYRKYISNMRKIALHRYFSFGKLFYDRSNQGYLFNILMYSTELAASRIQCIYAAIKYSLLLTIYFILMCIISWKLTVFVIIASPVLHYSLDWLIEKIKKTSRYYANSRDALSAKVSNILSCVPLVKLYMTEKKEEQEFGYASDEVAAREFNMDKKQGLIEPIQEMVLLIIILSLIALMAYLVIREKSGEISGFLLYFYLLRRSSGALNNILVQRGNLAVTIGPFDELLNIFSDRDKYFVLGGKREFNRLNEGIEFKKLNFSYIPEVQVLKDITFSIRKGEMTAIVGPTGSGKTTLISLVLRFYDCPPSSIMMDGIDIREFTLKSLRAHIALVSQETLLFNDTLRANIAYGIDNDLRL